MTTPDDLHVVQIEQQDPRLGRQVVHDPRSRRFEFPREVDVPNVSFRHRMYNPRPNPNQPIGCCTGVDACVKCNTRGNRVLDVVLNMDDAIRIYSRATQLDPWQGSYPPTDTGSSGLAACKAAKEQGLIERYEWVLGDTDQLKAALCRKPVGIGAWWYASMFNVDPLTGLVEVRGERVGGHQWTLFGWNKYYRAFEGLCWWGNWGLIDTGRFRIREADLADLRADDGDTHVTHRANRNG